MNDQLLAWEAMSEERKEGDKNKAKDSGLEEREDKRRNKNLSSASRRQSRWLSVLNEFCTEMG